MCDSCGCNITSGNRHLLDQTGISDPGAKGLSIDVLHALLHENNQQAAHNRSHFDGCGILALNIMSSPGSGKTSLLETTIRALADELRIGVLEGDLETENDAERIRATGVEAIQIVTGTACHLDAHMVHDALHQLRLDDLDLVFIENVGNLVCPASFDLGHHRNITLLSVTEGDDKPAKYPVIFRGADLTLLSKIDLLPYLEEFKPERAEHHLRNLANAAPMLPVSARTGEGIGRWLDWLRNEVKAHKERCRRGQTLRPAIQPEGATAHSQNFAAEGP